MKRVFVIGGYTSKSHYRKYMKIARNLQKNYHVVTLMDQVDIVYESDWKRWSAYCRKDLSEINCCDYVVAYLPGSVAYTNVAFLAGYAIAKGKPLFVVISEKVANSIDVVCSSTGTLLYDRTFGENKTVILEDYIGSHQIGKGLV